MKRISQLRSAANRFVVSRGTTARPRCAKSANDYRCASIKAVHQSTTVLIEEDEAAQIPQDVLRHIIALVPK